LANIYSITSAKFYNIFFSLVKDEKSIEYLDGKSIIFKYLEFLKENNKLNELDVNIMPSSIHIFVSAAIDCNLDEAQIFNKLINIMQLNIHIDVLNFIDCCGHIIKPYVNNIDEKYHIDYLFFTYAINKNYKFCYKYNDEFGNDVLVKKIYEAYLTWTNNNRLENIKWLTPKVYEYLLSHDIDLSKLKHSTNDSNLLLFVAQASTPEMLSYLVEKHNYNIYYKNKFGSDIFYFAEFEKSKLSKNKSAKMIKEINRLMTIYNNNENNDLLNIDTANQLKTEIEQLKNELAKYKEIVNKLKIIVDQAN